MKQLSTSFLTGLILLLSSPLIAQAEGMGAFAAAASSPVAMGQAADAKKTAKRPVKFDIYRYESDKVKPDSVVTIDNPWGDIRIRTHRALNVKIEGTVQRIGDDAPVPTYKPVEKDGVLSFGIEIPGAVYEPRSNRVDLVIYLPQKMKIAVKTKDGTIEAKKTISSIDATSESGKIVITNHGNVKAKSDKGLVQVQPMYSGWGEIDVTAGEAGAVAFLPDGDNFAVEVTGATELQTEFELEGELPGAMKMERGIAKDTYTIQSAGPVKVLKTVVVKRAPHGSGSMYGTLRQQQADRARAEREAKEAKAKEEAAKKAADDKK
ncbi:MAG: hypothetical protein MI750_10955 [Xanthomonadales bacterium]|nr:hypothetical protein [Xanthomonadales bacterium]